MTLYVRMRRTFRRWGVWPWSNLLDRLFDLALVLGISLLIYLLVLLFFSHTVIVYFKG